MSVRSTSPSWRGPRAVTWHRPLLWLSVAMAGVTVVGAVGLLVDPRIVTGALLWATPLKFAISILVYSLTLSFLLGLVRRGRRVAWWAGALIAVAGMGLAFLMTEATAIQLDNYTGIAGAHTVGVSDGGPGLPLLGWSTVAGGRRIPHFIGMHALQLIPMVALLLELLARRVPALTPPATRFRLLWVGIGLYLGVLALLTGQALAGQSIVRPDKPVTAIAALMLATAVLAAALILRKRVPTSRTDAVVHVVLVVLGLGPSAALHLSAPVGSVDDLIAREMPASGVPGVAYAVVTDGELTSVGSSVAWSRS